jgi:hypothetical protein
MADLRSLWFLVLFIPFLSGTFFTSVAGGATLKKRFFGAGFCGALFAGLLALTPFLAGYPRSEGWGIVALWQVFLFSLFSTVGAILTEIFRK